ncbi:MAG: M28 family peptidase [Williamsia sp.]|nr:M28 family peptidase [Williamsia sp.]
MKQLTASLLLLGLFLSGQAQKNPEKYAATITAADLKKHLTIVAGDDMQGRETGTEGQKRAAAYIESQFKSLGLRAGNKESFQQVYPLMQDTILSSHLQIGGKEYEFGKDYMLSATTSANKNISAQKIVFVGYGIADSVYNDYTGIDVKDAIVVYALGEPRQEGQSAAPAPGGRGGFSRADARKMQTAISKGAAAVLVLSPRMATIDATMAASQRRSNLYPAGRQGTGSDALNTATISQGLFKELFGNEFADTAWKKFTNSEKFTAADYKTVNKPVVFSCQKSSEEKANSSNVLAVLEGTDKKDEYVFLTAHYDHLGLRNGVIYHGADDDGSGTVSVLEMAEAFAKAKAEGNGPRRTIVFMTVSGEEKGLWGSAYYGDHPLFPLEKTTVDLNTDMVGRLDPNRTNGDSTNYVYVIGDDKLSSDLKSISETANNKYTKLELDYKYNDPKDPQRIYFRSDHYNFARKGVPILFYFDGIHADYHRPSDTVDKINFDVMQKRVRFIFHTAWEMANRNDMLKRDIPLPEMSR